MWREHFEGKVVIVTGGSTGIGAATASAFAHAGARTVVADVADGPGEAWAEATTAEGAEGHFRHCDVSDESDVEALFADVEATLGPPDVVFANAGVEWTKDVRDTTLAEWRGVLDINLTGVFLVARAALTLDVPAHRRA